MLKRVFTVCVLTFLLLSQGGLFAQSGHEWVVPNTDYLNNIIMSDTTSTGERVDPDRIYVLQRGETYLIDYEIDNTYPVRIVAADGDGPKPVVQLATNESTGNYPFDFIWMDGSVYLKGIVVSGMPDATYNFNSVLWVDASGLDIVIDDCVFANVSGQLIRAQNPLRLLKITNSTLGNMGFIPTSSFGTGKGIDFRAGSCDSAIFRNNTWVNIQDRLIRHRNSTAALNYFEFDHNTVVVSCSYDGLFELGAVGEKVVVKNNLLVDAYTFGRDTTDASRLAEFNGSGEYEADGVHYKMCILASDPPDTSIGNENTQFIVRNNYYSYTQPQIDWWQTNNVMEPYTMTSRIEHSLSDPSNAFIMENGIALGARPNIPFDLMNWYITPIDQGGAGKTRITTTDHDYDRKSIEYLVDTLDCTYPKTAAAYTGADNSQPAGDLNWWGIETGIGKDPTIGIPNEFNLSQNYPNPFNPTTNIKFSLPKTSKVVLSIYNVLGQQIAQLVNNELKAGNYNYEFNASSLSSGIYFYSLHADNFTMTKKMILLK